MSHILNKKPLDLPDGWISTRLGEICYIMDINHKMPKKAKGNGIPFISPKDFIGTDEIDFDDAKLISRNDFERLSRKCKPELGDILYSRIGTIGKVRIVPPKEFGISYSLAIIRRKDIQSINFIWLYFLVQSPYVFEQAINNKRSIGVPDLGLRDMKDFLIPLPPLAEQRRMVTKIEELFTQLDAGTKALKKIKMQLQQYRKSLLSQAFEGKLTERWREIHKDQIDDTPKFMGQVKEMQKENIENEYEEFISGTTGLPQRPEKWVWAKISDIGDIISGNTPKKNRQEYYGTDYPFFKPADLNAGYYVRTSTDGLSKIGIKKARLLPEKSILVTCIGATIGKTGFIRVTGASNQQINAIVPKFVMPEYIYFLFISPQINKTILANASSTTLPILNKSRFEKIVIPVSPLLEQHKIVEEIERHFSVIEDTEKVVKQSLKHADKLYQSILNGAFRGKLVAQDLTDEPADLLLKRIRESKIKSQIGTERFTRTVDSKQTRLL